MELSKVTKIIDTFHSKDWSEYYDYHNDPNLKKSIWIRLNRIPEFNFVFDSITEDIKKIRISTEKITKRADKIENVDVNLRDNLDPDIERGSLPNLK